MLNNQRWPRGRVSALTLGGRGSDPLSGHTKDHKMGLTALLSIKGWIWWGGIGK